MNPLLTPEDVARLLAKPRSFVMALARGGGIPSVMVGKRDRRFREEDVEAFIESKRAYTRDHGEATPTGQRTGHGLEGARPKKAVGRRRHRGVDDRGPSDPKGALRIVTSGGEGHAA